MSTSLRSTGWSEPSARQHARAHLRAATAAAHGDGSDRLRRLVLIEEHPRRRVRSGIRRHGRKLGELAHEAPVDPVFPAPHPIAIEAD
jgi:hypothetical protein